jgi:hypothetical protein
MPKSTKNQITIEKTPTYMYLRSTAEHIRQLDPNMKLIMILRDPVTKLISQYTDFVSMNKRYQGNNSFPPINEQTNSLHNQLFKEKIFESNNTIKVNDSYVQRVIYIKYIKQLLEYFPIKNLIVLNGHEFIKNPISQIDRLQKFLGIKKLIKKEHFKYDEKKGFQCMRIPIDSNEFTCLGDDKGRRNPIIDAHLVNELKRFYEPFNKELFEFLNVEPFW